ncbi:hypothetical protein J2Z65_001460 [Paenibacillus aceris]|uniref:Uncharacterized protein n=1 Tax=Paenibacillus aceris TaxID=869555 RepID=A0ABS4HV65_9BACL|nr:hypothetical protein [Paenibacillus aceris]
MNEEGLSAAMEMAKGWPFLLAGLPKAKTTSHLLGEFRSQLFEAARWIGCKID